MSATPQVMLDDAARPVLRNIVIAAIIVVIIMAAVTFSASAASYGCGRYMLRATHSSCGSSLARAWAENCQHTTAGPGAVVVQSRRGMDSSGKRRGGHVSLIERVTGPCSAIVRDNRGRRERDICRNLIAYVSP